MFDACKNMSAIETITVQILIKKLRQQKGYIIETVYSIVMSESEQGGSQIRICG